MQVTVFCPITGMEKTVELEDRYGSFPCAKTYNGDVSVSYEPQYEEDEEWIEVRWAMERTSDENDETDIEQNKTVTLFCPRCGGETTLEFEGEEFEHIDPCDDCGDEVFFIRDQPTESRQSHTINYEYHIYDKP